MREITIVEYELNDIVKAMNEVVKPDSFATPYKVSVLVNATLRVLELERVGDKKELPSQMFYQYLSDEKRYIKSQNFEGVSTWLTKYLKNNNSKFNKKS
jgi:hypothetical protein